MGKYTGWLGVAMLLGALAGCGSDEKAADAGKPVDVDFLADNAAWREQRRTELTAPDGWTSLVGLHWLELKSHFVGSGPGSGIRLAYGPAKLGMVTQQDKRVFLTPEAGDERTIDLDRIDREVLEVRERGIAGAEIVERDLDSAFLESLQRRADMIGASAEEHRLGHFDL